jgi:bifunctional oligoribonuclease and PAP phosphatase NrnA
MFQKIREIIDHGRRFLITAHIDPDGDAIGSAFSLCWALDSLKKESTVYLKDKVPYKYEFLPRPARFTHELPDGPFDGIFALDCGNLFRVGTGYEQLKDMGPIINIDHHKTNETFGLVNLIDENASSTAELLCSLYEFLNMPVSIEMATNIYTAILTDTGSFRFENTNSQAFLICEKMLRAGVKPAYVSQEVYSSHPRERFQLLGLVLEGLRTFDDGKVVIAHVTEEMFRRTHASRELTDGFVEFIKEMKGVEVAVFLRQVSEGYNVSMRSKGTVDVARICNHFGGGGHKNAAGCTIKGDLGDAEARLKEALKIE